MIFECGCQAGAAKLVKLARFRANAAAKLVKLAQMQLPNWWSWRVPLVLGGEERNIEYNLLSINIAINALVWGGAGPPMAWSVAFETSAMPFAVQRSSCTVHKKSKHSNFKRWRQDKKI